ncbi:MULTISPECIES: capsule biosynthesis protein [Rhizobium]|uniref:Capsular polysaccharide transport system permease protein n=1 Tax=Rhizobium miluonense TaxID=411945 RepID=A0ABU1SKV0_9HYPH|nr:MULTISPECIES: capsule biosynthesis protein [Rhizobium]MBB3382564.1 capsular polysaccharide transport system permease protein [Rhizobium sp. BK098]MBB3568710.1 capsular polysaccharide transport system permease protein [Rhizobium sp. BK491]MBB3614265.1 capsular polysaccharide transport system permease protein [Rhizobium sp. BK609]MBB3680349.1 capsular polysaccharide transport system permease protein [Rhizobium sp. BK612]MDR6899604.1 capsular polysaccharide transport system permease protein [R
MAHDTENAPKALQLSATEHSRNVAANLSVAARKLRFSTSRRSQLFKAVGLRPRPMQQVISKAILASTVLLLVIPNIASVYYFTCVASDQYQSETRFTVRTSTPALGGNQITKVTGLPPAQIVQNTLIVTNFIKSKDMVAALEEKVDFQKIYGNDSIDRIARLKKDASSEKLLDYWEDMVSVKIDANSGIVTVKARAFTAADAQKVLHQVVAASEVVVNDVNTRIWRDVIATAQANLDNAKDQLQKARDKLLIARNQTGVLSVEGSSTVITNLISSVQKERIDLQQKYDALLGTVSADAPQMRVLKREIDSRQKQIDQLNSQVAGQNKSEQNLADVSVDMSQRELEQSLAEQQFATSMKTLEQVKFVSKQQLLYLDTFLAPSLPDEAEYPQRALWIGGILGVTILAWGAVFGILANLRNRLA